SPTSVVSIGSRRPDEGDGNPPPSPLCTRTLTAASTTLTVTRVARTQRVTCTFASGQGGAAAEGEHSGTDHAERQALVPARTVHRLRAVFQHVPEAVTLRSGRLRDGGGQGEQRTGEGVAVLRHGTPP